MTPPPDYKQAIAEHGFAVVDDCIDGPQVNRLIAAIQDALAEKIDNVSVRRRNDVYAIRHLFDVVPTIRTLADEPCVRRLVEPILGKDAMLAKAVLFDKTADTNWGVFWHQDLSIAVRERADVENFDAWSQKAGIWHVQPPVEVLEKMLTVRLHLDGCTQTNGALKVIPGSHAAGRLTSDDVERWKQKEQPIVCSVQAGAAVVMRPLLLHASAKTTEDSHRRVLHFEFSATALPNPLQWYAAETTKRASQK